MSNYLKPFSNFVYSIDSRNFWKTPTFKANKKERKRRKYFFSHISPCQITTIYLLLYNIPELTLIYTIISVIFLIAVQNNTAFVIHCSFTLFEHFFLWPFVYLKLLVFTYRCVTCFRNYRFVFSVYFCFEVLCSFIFRWKKAIWNFQKISFCFISDCSLLNVLFRLFCVIPTNQFDYLLLGIFASQNSQTIVDIDLLLSEIVLCCFLTHSHVF